MKKNIEIKKYPSGAQIVLEKDVSAPYIAFAFNVFSGSFDENTDEFGVAHFVEHMVFKSTKNRTTEEMSKLLEEMGASINAWTDYQRTCFHFKCLKEKFDGCAEIYADMLTNPLFKDEEFEKERQVILEEIALYKDNPSDDTRDIAYTAMISNFMPHSHQIIGTEESVKAMTPDNLRSFMAKNYFGKNIILSVRGNIEMAEVERILEKHFKKYLFETKQIEKQTNTNLQITPEKSACAIQKDVKQVNLCIMIKGEKSYSKEKYVLDLYSRILGSGFSSRLFLEIRERMGLAYSVYSRNIGFSDFGFLNIYVGCNKSNLGKALTAIKQILKDIAQNSVTESELAKAKTVYKSSLAYYSEDRESVLQSEAGEYFITNNIKEDEELMNIINQITVEDIKAVANKIANEKVAICYASGNKLNEKDLQAFLNS